MPRFGLARGPREVARAGASLPGVLNVGMTEATPAASGVLLALCRVDRLLPDAGTVGVTAIDKRPVLEPLPVKEYGVYGDVQADRKNHGGPWQAVYAYAQEDAERWGARIGREIAPGLFGENLRTSGIDVTGAEIGERWRVGDELVLEVTTPRYPCATFQRRMAEKQWVKRFTEGGMPGAYLRVIAKGAIAVGDRIAVVERPGHGVTIGDWFRGVDESGASALEDAAERRAVELPPKVIRDLIARRAG